MRRPSLRGPATLRLSQTAGPLPARGLAVAAGAGVISTACSIGLLATSGWLLTRASQRPPVLDLAVAIGAVQAFALGRGITRYLQRLAVHGLALRTLTRLRLWLYDTLLPLVPDGLPAGRAGPATGGRTGPPAPGRGAAGSLLSGFVADTQATTEALATGTTAAVDVSASTLLGVAVAWLLAPSAAVALLGGAAAVIAVSVLVSGLGRPAAASGTLIRAELADQVMEALRSAPELLAFGRQDLIEARLDQVRRGARSAALRQAVSTGAARALATWAAGAGLILVVLAALAAHRAGQLSGITVTVVVLVSMAALDQAAALPVALAGRIAGGAAAARLADLTGLKPLAPEPPADASPPVGSVSAVLDHVAVSAPSGPADPPILSDVSLMVAPGRRVALAGPSGSGKSSTLHVLLHFLEASRGSAAIGGVDVRRMTRAGIARHVAWLADDTHLFAATLSDNLRLARPEATDAELTAALHQVGLGAWHRALPEGLATTLGAGGRALSAGERQRLGMARALLSDAGLMLLDEPTAHLDPWSSSRVLGELLGAAGTRAVLVVSHEPGIAGQLDEVITLERGRVVAHHPAA